MRSLDAARLHAQASLTVRAVLHLLATLVVLPYSVLATAFMMLDEAISAGSWRGFFGILLTQALWLIPWGIIAFLLGSFALAGLGFSARWHWLGGLLLCLIAAVSVTVLVVKGASAVGLDEAMALLPCVLVGLYGAWIVFDGLRSQRMQAESTETRG